jgi:hypothetical protein
LSRYSKRGGFLFRIKGITVSGPPLPFIVPDLRVVPDIITHYTAGKKLEFQLVFNIALLPVEHHTKEKQKLVFLVHLYLVSA